MPCGFCGRSGIRTCEELYILTGKRKQISAQCQHSHPFRYGDSFKSTITTPCTDTPIVCPIEPCTAVVNGKWRGAVWKYNMVEHIRTHHAGYSADGIEDGAPLPPSLVAEMEITLEEEQHILPPRTAIPYKPQSMRVSRTASDTLPAVMKRGRSEPSVEALTAAKLNSKRRRAK